MKHISLVLLSISILVVEVRSQLYVATGQTPQWYVENVLLSGGVQISNITYTGHPNAIGHFYTGSNPTNLGLTEGIILSTGYVNGSPAIGSPVSNFASTALNTPGDALLNSLIPGYTTYDATILEFDFVPLGDTIRFRYVFASEEYPEWVGSSYNDVFGFFVSGPNPLGGNYVNKNIALIPNTSTPVSINNVNQNTNWQYFVDNQALGGQTIVFDGFTTVLTAWCHVVPCQTYHLKIAIADAGDRVYDSAVFLEANSLSSNAFYTQVEYVVPGGQQFAVEGCADAFVHFYLQVPQSTDFTINYTIGGTATYGVDYDPIPTFITIPAGQTSATLPISPIYDGITEGTESIYLIFTNSCGVTDTIKIFIWDYQIPSVTVSGSTSYCQSSGTMVQIGAQMQDGFPPYGYTWNQGIGNVQNPIVSPTTTTTYTVTAQDYCGYQAQGQVTITVHPDPMVQVTPSQSTICQGESITLNASGASIYFWQPGNISGATLEVSPNTNTTYTVIGTDNNGCTGSATATVLVSQAPTVDFTGQPTEGCAPVTVQFLETTQDTSITQWFWNFGDGQTSNQQAPTHTYNTSGTYTVSLTTSNQYNCSKTMTKTNYINVWPQPIADVYATPEFAYISNPTIQFFSNTESQYWLWLFGDGQQSTSPPPVTHTYPQTENQYTVTLIAFNEHGCSDTITMSVYILDNELQFPNVITPNGDGINDFFEIKNVHKYPNNLLQVYNRWGKLVFEMQNYDNSWDGGNLADGSYFYIFRYLDKEFKSSLTIIRK